MHHKGRFVQEMTLFAMLSLAVFSLVTTASAQSRSDLQLTDEERDWLAEHQQIRIGPAPNFPPVEFFDDEGQCLDPAVEAQIRSVATHLLTYIQENICPRVTLEALVRADAV